MKIKIFFITILNFVDHIMSYIGNIIMCIIKYYTHLTYFDEKKQKRKDPSHNTTKTDRVYKSPKSIRKKVN